MNAEWTFMRSAPSTPCFCFCAGVRPPCMFVIPGAVGTVYQLLCGLCLTREICVLWLVSTLVLLPSLDERSSVGSALLSAPLSTPLSATLYCLVCSVWFDVCFRAIKAGF